MMDDGIREVHGVKAHLFDDRDKRFNVVVDETVQGTIRIGSFYKDVSFTPAEARYLARKLYRLARRIDKRAEPQS